MARKEKGITIFTRAEAEAALAVAGIAGGEIALLRLRCFRCRMQDCFGKFQWNDELVIVQRMIDEVSERKKDNSSPRKIVDQKGGLFLWHSTHLGKFQQDVQVVRGIDPEKFAQQFLAAAKNWADERKGEGTAYLGDRDQFLRRRKRKSPDSAERESAAFAIASKFEGGVLV